MLKAKVIEEKILKLVGHREGEVAFNFELNKKKLMVGRAAHADIYIDDPAISFYHAFIIIDEHGGKIIDLESDNGIFLNGKKVEKSYFCEGDTLRIGPIELHIEEEIIESVGDSAFEDQDEGIIEKINTDKILDLPPELPPMPGLVVIDGEYCDIVFDESTESHYDEIPALERELSVAHYIDPEDEKDENEIPQIARTVDQMAIEVSVLLNGNIISLDYLPIKKKTFYVSSLGHFKNTLCVPNLDTDDRLPFIDISGNDITIHKLDAFTARNRHTGEADLFGQGQQQSLNLKKMDILSFDNKGVQIVIRLTDAPPLLKMAPFFGRDRAFQMQTAKIVGAVMGLMLLLLFIDTTVEQPKKKIAVIYRKAIKSKKPSDTKSKSIADKVDKDTGVKKTKQPNQETKMAKKTPTPQKKPTKTKAMPKMAKAASQAQKVKKAPKMKAYKFKSKTKLSSLFSSTKNLKPNQINKKSAATGTQGFKSATSASDAKVSANTSANVGTLGQDFSGNYDRSSGAQGLSSKSGVDTTYSDPKTVVLGSMDPELLRKILKEYLPQFRHCYQKELESNEAAKGVIDLHFRINADGSVSKINIRGKKARFSKSGSNCMAGVLRLIDFPKPKGGGVVDVKQPLNFFSEKGSY
ncbi:MAG: hypothetical protein CME60_09335 [Halobacteriovoraceae bacterium]|nr:hypothetical protein [Halobacteriovoraceae bacterium]